MDITIHQTYLPYDDPDASLAFDRDTVGFEVRIQATALSRPEEVRRNG